MCVWCAHSRTNVQESAELVEGKIPACEDALAANNEADEEELSMPLNSLSGTFYFALFIQALSLLLGLFEYFTKRTIQDWLVRN